MATPIKPPRLGPRGPLGRALCGICGGHYQRDPRGAAGHLASRRHRGAEIGRGLPPGTEDAQIAFCQVCGGSTGRRRRRVWSDRHRKVAATLALDPRFTELP